MKTPRIALPGKVLIAFVIVLLPMLALIVYDYFDGYHQRTEAILDEQSRAAQAVGALVDASIEDATTIAWSFANNPVVRTMDSRQIDPYLQSFKASLVQYDNIAVLDLKGNAVGLMTGPPEPEGARPTAVGRRYFEDVKSTGLPAVSEILISRATGNPTVVTAVPMIDEMGSLVGVTLAALDLDYLAKRVGTVGLRPSQAIFLTDREGTLAFHTQLPEEQWGRVSFADYPFVRSALAGMPGRERETTVSMGDARMVATSRTPEFGWVVGVSIPTAGVAQAVQAELLRRLVLFAAALGFAVLLAFLLSHHFLLRPLEKLADHLLSLGQGKLQRRIDLHTGDELELLGQTLNTMADRLQRAGEEKDAALAEARHRAGELDTIIGSMAEGVAIVNRDGQLVRLNRAAREIVGLPADETVPVTLEQFRDIDVLDQDCLPITKDDRPIYRVLRGETFAEQELIYRKPDGNWLNLLFAGTIVRGEDDAVTLGVTVFRDITSFRELERQREEFISVVAHDLRNAIAIVSGYSALLQRLPPEAHNTAKEYHAIQSVNVSVRRLERMVSDLLDLSRLEARRLTLTKKRIDLGVLVPDIVHRLADMTKGHPTRVDVCRESVRVEADPDRIEQVLSNLLSNAGKYSYPDSEITVSVESLPSEALVSVTNLGMGIPPEGRDKLFTRWYRVRAAGEEKAAGLGLGLYITKGLVESHGGRLWVESAQGKYATFRFTLPLIHEEASE